MTSFTLYTLTHKDSCKKGQTTASKTIVHVYSVYSKDVEVLLKRNLSGKYHKLVLDLSNELSQFRKIFLTVTSRKYFSSTRLGPSSAAKRLSLRSKARYIRSVLGSGMSISF